jgi:hypothetical protein
VVPAAPRHPVRVRGPGEPWRRAPATPRGLHGDRPHQDDQRREDGRDARPGHHINEGRLAEQEITFHAQDDDGNVWNFGEYPEEYENGTFMGAPSTWLAGVRRANAGILMRDAPKVGTSSYLQGEDPDVEFRDRARVSKSGQKRCVPQKCYEDLLVIDESSPLDPADGHQLKYYARGVGNVLIEPRGGAEQETLVLVEVKRLDAKALAEARSLALELDKRAYTVVPEVFRGTPRATRSPSGEAA